VFLLGNPLSGLTSAPELLPQPWGAVGQLLAAATEASRLHLPAGGHAREPTAPLQNPA